MRQYSLAITVLLLIVGLIPFSPASALPSRSDIGQTAFQGPADLRNQRPYHLLFLSFSPETAKVLAPKEQVSALQLDIANDLFIPASVHGEKVIEDTETQRLAYKMRYGLSHATEVSFSVPVIARNGGILDRIIKAYHSLIGSQNHEDVAPGRGSIPPFRSTIELIRPDGTTEVNVGPTFGLGDISLFIKHGLVSGPWTAVAVRAGLKIPTGSASQLIGSGGTDAGIDLDARFGLSRRFTLYGSGGYLWMQKATRLNTAATHQFQYSAALEYEATHQASWVLQFEGSDVVVFTGNPHADSYPATAALSYKRLFHGGTLWTFSLTENGDIVKYKAPWFAGIGSDVAVSVGAAWRH